MSKYRNYCEEDIVEAVKNSTTVAAVLTCLNLKSAGGNYASIQQKIDRLGIDVSHFKGMGWNKGNFKPLVT